MRDGTMIVRCATAALVLMTSACARAGSAADQPQPVPASRGTSTSITDIGVQQLQGTVFSVDINARTFTMELQGYGIVTVVMPLDASRTEIARFQRLRRGDVARFYGVFQSQSRIELREFV